jgi:hypothetical protein
MKKKMNTAVLASSEAQTIPKTSDLQFVGENLGAHDLKNQDDTPFFYRILIIDGEDTIYQEFGVGYVYKTAGIARLRREKVLESWSASSGEGDSRSPKRIKVTPGSRIFVSTGTPSNYRDMFVHPNSVLCCSEPDKPLSVELQNNTLLGRFNNIIQSIDQNELWTILLDDNKKPVKGSIRYNDENNFFEGYDGERWRTLMWGDE